MEVSGLASLALVAKQALGRQDMAVEMTRMQMKAEQSVVDMVAKSADNLRQQGRGQAVDILA